jgi:hypothetical protein
MSSKDLLMALFHRWLLRLVILIHQFNMSLKLNFNQLGFYKIIAKKTNNINLKILSDKIFLLFVLGVWNIMPDFRIFLKFINVKNALLINVKAAYSNRIKNNKKKSFLSIYQAVYLTFLFKELGKNRMKTIFKAYFLSEKVHLGF